MSEQAQTTIDAERDRQDFAAEEVGDSRFFCSSLCLGVVPFLRLRHVPPNPEHEQRREHADEENPARVLRGHEIDREAGEEDADIHPGLKHRRDPRTPARRPRFGKQARADRPFAADAERGEKAEDEQLPPGLREARETGESGVGENGEAQRAAAPELVADASEESAAERPADEERRLNPRALLFHKRIVGAVRADELHHERRRDERVEMHVQPVEHPAEPRGEAGLFLL